MIDKNGQHETTLDTPAGEVEWKQPKTRLKKSRRDFFPQAQALGLDVDEMFSPSLLDVQHFLSLHLFCDQECDFHRLFVVQPRIDLAAIVARKVGFGKVSGATGAFGNVFTGKFKMNTAQT